jgi:stearoyl-CoA desaturase (Delta-9 desaturase)
MAQTPADKAGTTGQEETTRMTISNVPERAKQLTTIGVVAANNAFRKVERRIALAVVCIPTLGIIAAVLVSLKVGFSKLDMALLVGLYAAGAFGIEGGYHRLFSHRAFKASSGVRAMFVILGAISAQGPPIFWAAIHRRHHQYADREGDPHSPHVYPDGSNIRSLATRLWHSHVGWLFSHEITDWPRYVPDLIRDTALFKLNRFYFIWVALGLAFPAALAGVLTGSWTGALTGFLWGGPARIFLTHNITWAVNSICHVYGSRPFDTKDKSTNNAWLSLLSLGGSWHNNHHAYPTLAILTFKWWQIDLSGLLIRLLRVTGLAHDVGVPVKDPASSSVCGRKSPGRALHQQAEDERKVS